MTVGPSFKYTIPNFEALVVELRQIRVEQTLESGEAEGLMPSFAMTLESPVTVLANSTFTIEVCMQVDSSICGVCVCVCVCPGQNPSHTSLWCPGVTVASLLPANMTWLVE